MNGLQIKNYLYQSVIEIRDKNELHTCSDTTAELTIIRKSLD